MITEANYKARNLQGFEGDSFMKDRIKTLIDKHKINLVIETGTYLGGTTNQLRQMAKEVLTIEINEAFQMEARETIQDHGNVTMLLGNSPEKLAEVFADKKTLKKRILILLDAHWGNVCPLHQEMAEIAKAGIKPVIVIHDFFVPGKTFGYDSYNGKRFDLAFVQDSLNQIYGVDGFTFFYNDIAEGARRGVIYVEPKIKE